ncbi:DUF2442 domain-containing protein [Roseitalea porphyridii]|uniref:DUF2442 domain-containing protein n=1 Tax=Roseitalea porphyridii TaxID=1852022 RepID=A0A4P6UYY3_9HYPH|nr:DUF2442 domain-containing protein [Roseitalea porphyridii]QBK29170.1 DUF2442 domain-containing protein [Roseitalea porphyridii]
MSIPQDVRAREVEVVLPGVLKMTWDDGYVGLVDIRPIIKEGPMFAFLRDDPDSFAGVRIGEHGHSIYWQDPQGNEIDFGADTLRQRAERQAAILELAS